MYPGMSLCLTPFEGSITHMARARRGKFPKNVMLAAPHTNEHPTVLLPQLSLQRSLERNGVEVKTRNTFGMMAKLWKLRTMLDREFPGNSRDGIVKDLLTPILSIRDLDMRLQAMADFFRKNPEGVFMELHAMSSEVMLNASSLSLKDLEEFLQISGTNMLICREVVRSFRGSMASAKENEAEVYCTIEAQISQKHREKVKDLILQVKARIGEFCGFSTSKATEQCEANISELEGKEDRIFLVEIPSQCVLLKPTHFMHKAYYQPRLQDPGYASISSSRFEEVYATCTRESMGFPPRDAEALLNQMKVC